MKIFKDRRPLYGQDPYVVNVDGQYLLCESQDEKRITISTLESLQSPVRLETKVVWDNPREQQVWAPELHFINGLWYIYYTASDGDNKTHRPYVLQTKAKHPLGTPYHTVDEPEVTKIAQPIYYHFGRVGPDIWGIDMTQFEWNGIRYAVWSGWENNGDEFPQNLYIAVMDSPWRIRNRIKLSVPELDWELSVAPILEGPQVWIQGKQLNILYSANASWKQEYSTGLLTLVGRDPLNPGDWEKRSDPVMKNAGHGCFIDDHFVYHRKLSAFPGWTDREIRILKVR